jgi:[acyl-carrier-protein] S-malonyltransferase
MSGNGFIFAGQGAQFVGMGKDLAQAYPECRRLFARADEILGYSLSTICFEGPLEELTKSNRCQPAIFVTSIACWTALGRECPALPAAGAAGLSLGEWSALHMAGALTFEHALRILEARGRFMQEACEEREGAMVSVIGLPVEKLREICSATGVEIANFNSPEQTVLSGSRQGIREAEKLATGAGAKRAIVLNVAGAFHSSLMASAAAKLEKLLAGTEMAAPRIPVVSNATGLPHGGPDDIRREMVRQVVSPVQWLACVGWFKSRGVDTYVECGPGKVLSGLVKRIDSAAKLFSIQDSATLKKVADDLKGA